MVFPNLSSTWFPEGHFILDVPSCSPLCLSVIQSPGPLQSSLRISPLVGALPFSPPLEQMSHLSSICFLTSLKTEAAHRVLPTGRGSHTQPQGLRSICRELSGGQPVLGGEAGDSQMGQGSSCSQAQWSVQGPNAGMVPSASGSSPFWAEKKNKATCLVCFK